MTHRKRIRKLEETLKALIEIKGQLAHDPPEAKYVSAQINRLQNTYKILTGAYYREGKVHDMDQLALFENGGNTRCTQ